MSKPRVIKKYPNRRLYDTEISSYITLEDVRRLVLDHEDFRVRDAKSDQDITRTILLQIILEQEEDGEPIFTTEILEQIIRFYGDSLQGVITSYLEKSMRLFVEQQHQMREQVRNVMTGDPISYMRGLAEQNLNMWKEMQDSFFTPPAGGPRESEESKDQKAPPEKNDKS